jgi:glucokinase
MADEGTNVGVDIGASKTELGFLDGGRLRRFFRAPTPQEPGEAVAMIVEAIRGAPLPAAPRAVGIGCPGPLDQDRGIVLAPPNLPQWDELPLAARISDALRVPAALENDANAGALGEAVFGSGKGFRRVFYMTVSTGLGSGIVIDGRIYRGAMGLAGEIWSFEPGAFAGGGGDNLLDIASGNGLIKQVRRRVAAGEATTLGEEATPATVFAAAAAGDALAAEVVEQARDALAGAVGFVLCLLSPDIVVLGGGLCTEPDQLVAPVAAKVRQQMGIAALAEVPIRRAALWRDAVLYGAIRLAERGAEVAT